MEGGEIERMNWWSSRQTHGAGRKSIGLIDCGSQAMRTGIADVRPPIADPDAGVRGLCRAAVLLAAPLPFRLTTRTAVTTFPHSMVRCSGRTASRLPSGFGSTLICGADRITGPQNRDGGVGW